MSRDDDNAVKRGCGWGRSFRIRVNLGKMVSFDSCVKNYALMYEIEWSISDLNLTKPD